MEDSFFLVAQWTLLLGDWKLRDWKLGLGGQVVGDEKGRTAGTANAGLDCPVMSGTEGLCGPHLGPGLRT